MQGRATTACVICISEPFGINLESTADDSTLGRPGTEALQMARNGGPGTVDGLHLEIQRLQARIMSQLRGSQSEEKVRAHSQLRGSPLALKGPSDE